MKVSTAISSIMKEKGITQAQMAEMMGKSGASAISGRLAKQNLTVKSVLAFTDLLDYELVLQPKGEGYVYGAKKITLE